MKNYYRILGVKPTATQAELKTCYRALAKRFHPDVNPDDAEAARRFASINEAYDVLSDPQKRAEYDAQLARTAELHKTPPPHAKQTAQAAWQAQFQAQVQQQVQQQVQAQLATMRDTAFKAGYDQGRAHGERAMRNETERCRRQVSEVEHDRSDLEQELFDRDRELAETRERMLDLETRLHWFRKATKTGVMPTDILREQTGVMLSRADELIAQISMIENVTVAVDNEPSALHDRGKELKSRADALKKNLETLNADIAALDEDSKRQRLIVENEQTLAAIEARATAWSKKLQNDTRAAKPTLYGTLGVLIWATEQEIDEAYENLCTRYADTSQTENKIKLQKIKAAYSTLSDPQKRAEYNKSLGYDQRRIDRERRLIDENQAALVDYRNKLAIRDFWIRFDELSALALADDADAQNALGELYYAGKIVPRNPAQAVYWFREAFEHKHPKAIYNLGVCYINGEGVGRNRSIGQSLIRQAENLGYSPAKSAE